MTFFNNFNGTYIFAPGAPFPFDPTNPASFPVNFSESFGISGLHYNEKLVGPYVQDDYNILPNLTINLGLRYDYETLMHDTNNFAPRIGIAWDPFKTGKTLVRASFGIFYATIESSLINRESNFGPGGVLTLNVNQGDPLFPMFPARYSSAPNGGNFIKDSVFIPIVRGLSTTDFPDSVGNKFGGLRVNPYTEQFDLGVQRQIVRDVSLSVDYIHVHGDKLLRTEDENAPPFFFIGPTPAQERTQAQADALRPFGVPSTIPGPLGVNFGGYRELYLQESGDQSFYDALQVVLAKRFSRNFSLQINYTYSHAISDSDNFRTFSSLHLDPTNYRLDRGNATQNTPQNFTLFGVYQFPWGIRFGGIFTAFSGLPYSGLVGFDAGCLRRRRRASGKAGTAGQKYVCKSGKRESGQQPLEGIQIRREATVRSPRGHVQFFQPSQRSGCGQRHRIGPCQSCAGIRPSGPGRQRKTISILGHLQFLTAGSPPPRAAQGLMEC